MSGPRAIVKSTTLRAFDLFGVHGLASGYRKARLLVGCYHGVVSRDHSANPSLYGNTVSEKEFAWQLEQLGRWFEFTDLAGVRKWLSSGGRPKKPPVLISFDDGYQNNLTIAAPVLRRAGVPAVFFLTTGYIGTDRLLWPLEMEARLLQSQPGNLCLVAERRSYCKSAPNAERLQYLEQLRAGTTLDPAAIDREQHDFLSWDEVRTLAAQGFELGSHTVEHPILSRLDAEELRRELQDSRARISAETGRDASAIAYPNGGADDFTPEVCAAAAEAGYSLGFAVGDHFAERRDGPFSLRRWIISGHRSPEVFRYTISGLRDLLS
jgi:peptidoglycan/xylan/chitin deacetylase (PgdA/CDA1 family)